MIQDDVLGDDDDEDDDDDVSPAAVQQAAIQEDAPAAADTEVDTIQADAATPEVYEDSQQFDQVDNDISGQTNVKDDVAELSAAKPAADEGESRVVESVAQRFIR